MVTMSLQGHINPMLNFAKRLISKGVQVTIVTTEDGRGCMLKNAAASSSEIKLEFFSDGLSIDFDRSDTKTFINTIKDKGVKNFSNLITNLTKNQTFSCAIVNSFVPWAIDVIAKHEIPCALLWIQASALYSIYYRYFKNIDSFPKLDDPNEKVELPGLPMLEVRDLPSLMLPSSSLHFKELLADLFKALDKVKWVLGCSFYEIEEEIVKSMDSLTPIYPIGPLVSPFLLDEKEIRFNIINSEIIVFTFNWNPYRKNKREEKKATITFGFVVVVVAAMVAAGVWSDDNTKQLEGTIHYRKLVSVNANPQIDEVIQSGVVPRLVEFLARDDFPQLQVQAGWILTNIAGGTSENTKVVIDHGAVPILVKLLSSPDDDVREQAIWALGNVAGDSPRCRDLVLSYGALIPLLSQFNERAESSMLGVATWALSNFCRGKPQPPFEQVRPALPALARLVFSNDIELIGDACWALSYLSDGTKDNIQAVIEAGVCGRLVELLRNPSPSVVFPALRTVGLITTGDDMQTQVVINHRSLPCLLRLLTGNHRNDIKKYACWTISNIVATNREKIQVIIDAGLIAPMVNLYQNAEFDLKNEIVWALYNATCGATNEQIKYLVSLDYIKPLCDFLVCPDPIIVAACLKGLEIFLKVGEAEKSFGNTKYVNLLLKFSKALKAVTFRSHLVDSTSVEDFLCVAGAGLILWGRVRVEWGVVLVLHGVWCQSDNEVLGLQAELHSIYNGLRLTMDQGFNNVIESNSTIAICLVVNDTSPFDHYAPLIKKI
ncbi:importin subunit alpha-2 [Trifolium repens]|nr:importin subunit alpha-2 [Trifolium repens]